MANQPPSSRPWFRLASQIRMEQPPPRPPSQQTPAPVATPPAAPRPMFGRLQSFLPLTPQTTEPPPPQQPPSQGRPMAPAQPPAVSSSPATVPSRPPSSTPLQPSPEAPRSKVPPPESPRVVKPFAPTPPESPRRALPTPPPTPLQAQANTEPEIKLPTTETVKARAAPTPTSPRSSRATESATLDQKSPSSVPAYAPAPQPPSSPYSKRFQEPHFKKPDEDKATVTESAATKFISPKKKKPSASSEAPATAFGMLTLAGDNTGAHMELWGKHRRGTKPPERFAGRFYQLKEDPNGAAATAEEKGKKNKKAAVTAAGPMAALVNSNVQGANNSILFNSTCVHGSPGVHIFLSSSNNRRRRKDAPYGSKMEGGNNGDGYR